MTSSVLVAWSVWLGMLLGGNYTEQCDMWSLGVLTYILLDGRAPFMGRNDRQTYRMILEGPTFWVSKGGSFLLPDVTCHWLLLVSWTKRPHFVLPFFVAIESKVAFSQTKHLKNAIYLILILKIRLKKNNNKKHISPSTPLVFPKISCQPFTPNNLGQPPMPSPSASAPGQYRFSEERWSNVSENAKGFIRKLLQVDPTQRMTAEDGEGVKFSQGGGDRGWELK